MWRKLHELFTPAQVLTTARLLAAPLRLAVWLTGLSLAYRLGAPSLVALLSVHAGGPALDHAAAREVHGKIGSYAALDEAIEQRVHHAVLGSGPATEPGAANPLPMVEARGFLTRPDYLSPSSGPAPGAAPRPGLTWAQASRNEEARYHEQEGMYQAAADGIRQLFLALCWVLLSWLGVVAVVRLLGAVVDRLGRSPSIVTTWRAFIGSLVAGALYLFVSKNIFIYYRHREHHVPGQDMHAYLLVFGGVLAYLLARQATLRDRDGHFLVRLAPSWSWRLLLIPVRLAVLDAARQLRFFVPFLVPTAVFVWFKYAMNNLSDIGIRGFHLVIHSYIARPAERLPILVVTLVAFALLIAGLMLLLYEIERALSVSRFSSRTSDRADDGSTPLPRAEPGERGAGRGRRGLLPEGADTWRQGLALMAWRAIGWALAPPFERGFHLISFLGSACLFVALGQAASWLLREGALAYPNERLLLIVVLALGGAVIRSYVWLNLKLGFREEAGGLAAKLSGPIDRLWRSRVRGDPRQEMIDRRAGAGLLAVILVFLMAAVLNGALGYDILDVLLLRHEDRWLGFPREHAPALATLGLLGGSGLLGLGVLSVVAFSGALWYLLIGLRARPIKFERAGVRLLSTIALGVPYLVVLVLVRARYGDETLVKASFEWGRALSYRPTFFSMTGAAPGFLWGSLFLGLPPAAMLVSWLSDRRAAYLRSSAARSDRLMIGLRQGFLRRAVFLGARRELSTVLLTGLSMALLVDLVTSSALDVIGAGQPLHPSMGAALYLVGKTAAGTRAVPSAVLALHLALILAAGAVIARGGLQRRAPLPRLDGGGGLRIGGQVIVRQLPRWDSLRICPSLQFLLGPSGAGKTLSMSAWMAERARVVRVPQDPDDALGEELSLGDVHAVVTGMPDGPARLGKILNGIKDHSALVRLGDPVAPVRDMSRGERQRLIVALGLTVAPELEGLLLDECSASQDPGRTRLIARQIRRACKESAAGATRLVLSSHDPVLLDHLLGVQGQEDSVVWMEPDGDTGQGSAEAKKLSASLRSQGSPILLASGDDDSGVAPTMASRFVQSVEDLLSGGDEPVRRARARSKGRARSQGHASAQDDLGGRGDALRSCPRPAPGVDAAPSGEVILDLPEPGGWRIQMGPDRTLQVVERGLRLHAGSVATLDAPSGYGKSRLFEYFLAYDARVSLARVGYVPQDCARALPDDMTADELMAPVLARRQGGALRELLKALFGDESVMERLSRRLSTFSEGERQRLFLAQALLSSRQRPNGGRGRVLLLDEALGAMDPPLHTVALGVLAKEVAEPRTAVVLVTHSAAADRHILCAQDSEETRPPITKWVIRKIEKKEPRP